MNTLTANAFIAGVKRQPGRPEPHPAASFTQNTTINQKTECLNCGSPVCGAAWQGEHFQNDHDENNHRDMTHECPGK